MESRFEVIDAFVDGERVDTAALKRALSEADGRDYFVDAWLLREGVQDELALDAVPPAEAPARPARGWPLLAVAASVACLAVGGLAGYQMAHRAGEATPDAPAIVNAPVPAATSFPVPAATRAISVEFSPDGSAARGGD
jgi:hypothetical protein